METSSAVQPNSVDPVLADRIPALEYHDTEYNGGETIRMTTAWFLEQLQWLSNNGFRTLTGDEIAQFALGNSRPPQKSCLLRFDLGMPIYKNLHDVVIPTLEKHSFHAVFFVLTSSMKDTPKGNYVCWDHLREWEQAGLIEVGSHGVNHPDYRKASTPTRLSDLKTSKRTIEMKLGHPVSFFAFPYDSVPNHPDVLLKLFGYQLGFAGHRTERSILFKDPNLFALPCYYPYSGKKTYPLISGTKKLTFGQMIEAAVAVRSN
jgi:peptidoglycan/xylan/chitin deacetylase (PgdA/CDA1 family)